MNEILSLLKTPAVSIIGFIITISFLVAIHEFGHLIVAKWFGVKILKFSVGFGKAIKTWTGKDGTEYCIAWIPLGGYVSLYGESEETAKQQQKDNAKSFKVDNSKKATNNIDTSDFTNQDKLNKKYNTKALYEISAFKRLLVYLAGPGVNIIFAVFALALLFSTIGVKGVSPVIGSISANSQMQSVQFGDKIISVNNQGVETINDTIILLINNLGSNADLEIITAKGNKKIINIDLTDYKAGDELALEKKLGFNWAISELRVPAVILGVSINSPASKAGMMANDKIISLNNKGIKDWSEMTQIIKENPQKTIPVMVLRNNKMVNLTITPKKHPNNNKIGYAGISAKVDKDLYDKYYIIKKYSVFKSINKSISANILQAKVMLKTFARLIKGKASTKNLGGPLSIADYSGKTIAAGYETYFYFLASISLVIAVMNLLPIPVLDGGRIVLCLIEIFRGKPLGEKSSIFIMRIGLVILGSFMVFVLSLDFYKYIEKFFL